MNILFLDIDGVLNSIRSAIAFNDGITPTCSLAGSLIYPVTFERANFKLDEIAIKLLQKVVSDNDLKIVISSTNRIGSCIEHFHRMFALYNWDTHNIIIDMTPITPKMFRGDDVRLWLQNNEYRQITNYIILDDCEDFYTEQKTHLARTNIEYGLTHKDIEKIEKILKI